MHRPFFDDSLSSSTLTLVATTQTRGLKTFAWKATGKGGTIYLVGSIHVMSESFYPLNPALEAAFKDSICWSRKSIWRRCSTRWRR